MAAFAASSHDGGWSLLEGWTICERYRNLISMITVTVETRLRGLKRATQMLEDWPKDNQIEDAGCLWC